jgi:predicted metalloprotease with PDZ domain
MRTTAVLLIVILAHVASAVESDRFAWADGPGGAAGPGMALAVDLTDLPGEGLVYARCWLDAPADGALVFPKWIPGTHAPSGPVANLGGLAIADESGATVRWERDARDPWKIIAHAEPGAHRLRVDLTYIANHADENSVGVDIESDAAYGLVNWNCCLFHAADARVAELPCSVRARLPRDWDFASALPVAKREEDLVRFATLPLAEVIDRPLLIGSKLQHIVLRDAPGRAPVSLHIASVKPVDGVGDAAALAALRRLPDEAEALFGGCWFPRFEMLLRIGPTDMGLEHACSSVNGVLEELSDRHDVWTRELLPHEFTHSWVGKNRRPRGMLTPTWQETPDFDGLWVYEGLTELLGRVLAVRCGLMAPEDWRAELAQDITDLASQPGRHWRSLRDTCRCTWQLRAPIPVHPDLRRSQEYYLEGALFWLAADRRIRAASGGRKSLDDFCRSCFGPDPERARGFDEDEVVADLAALAPGDWAAAVRRWVDEAGDLDVAAVLGGSGWRLSREPVDPADDVALSHLDGDAVREMIGCSFSGGYVTDVDDGSVAATAGLAAGDYVFSANGIERGKEHLAIPRALAGAVAPHSCVLLVKHGDAWKTVQLSLPKPLRIAALVRDGDGADAFAPLLAPHVAAASAAGAGAR